LLPIQCRRFALRSTLTLIIPEDILEEPVMMVMVVARSSAIAGIIAGMLAFVHTFTVGTVNFGAVGFGDIFVP
jgi:1,4-dihydroxy-2-naphthoate octaprenyltransferase